MSINAATSAKASVWGDEEKGHCHRQFCLFDETGGVRGWDPDKMDDSKYIIDACAGDGVVTPWASTKNGGTNQTDTKLLRNYKKSAQLYVNRLPAKWADDPQKAEKFLLAEEKEFNEKYQFEYENGDKIELGQGTFGVVYKGTRTNDGAVVAIKIPKLTDRQEAVDAVNSAIKEVRIWENVGKSPFVLPLLDHFVLPNNRKLPVLCTISPCVSGGTLFDYVFEIHSSGLPMREGWLGTMQLMLAVEHMHANRIVHRDIKPDNIMVEKTSTGELSKILVIDLGTAKRLADGRGRSNTKAGTEFYMAPEVSSGNYYMEKVDVYSVGKTMLLTSVGTYPVKSNPCSWYDEGAWSMEQVLLENQDNPLVTIAKDMVADDPYMRSRLSDALGLVLDARPSDPESIGFLGPHDDDFTDAYDLIGRRKGMVYLKRVLKPGGVSESDVVTSLRVQLKNLKAELEARRSYEHQIKEASQKLLSALGNRQGGSPSIPAAVSHEDEETEIDDLD